MGKIPDIEALAKETGIDPDIARDAIKQIMDTINKRIKH